MLRRVVDRVGCQNTCTHEHTHTRTYTCGHANIISGNTYIDVPMQFYVCLGMVESHMGPRTVSLISWPHVSVTDMIMFVA